MTQVWSLGWEESLEEGMATHSNILAWKIQWTEEPGRLQSMRLQRVRHDWAALTFFHLFLQLDRVWLLGLRWPSQGHRVRWGCTEPVQSGLRSFPPCIQDSSPLLVRPLVALSWVSASQPGKQGCLRWDSLQARTGVGHDVCGEYSSEKNGKQVPIHL